ncbi:hypothetical protein GUITHDRAFT_100650 [Guillardia theta CCMP2712]|uniref:Uncharacterized protein n=2 Tax=Guillardia theta TaxID=55529 RepID=L1JZ75_GUITC|nr:hypothetical protein GUITHDRAFT_100650 [Guillardia theta CCMP2712]EKX53672.1 hypothetical protein GUITHDRAFT_100650 [Guillardia theta CCMP2712]|eukprot:XP_005840652.1 hypothetical protein GUITHDRAFT_100650 [Guillardia theta CCMP2712]
MQSAVLLALACAGTASAFAPSSSLPNSIASARPSSLCSLRMQSREVDLLERVETLKVLSAVSKAGVLSKVEKSGLLSKLEKSGALSKAEELLPLLDDYRVISLTKKIVSVSPGTLYFYAMLALGADAAVIAGVPDNSGALIAAQVATTVAILPLVGALIVGGKINSIIQGNEPLKL